MYAFVDYTYNAIKGRCQYDCNYCFMKRFKLNEPRLDEKEFKTDLGNGNFIFVGSSIDMFADTIPSEWIESTLEHCRRYDNKYLFQSKNPMSFSKWQFPRDTVLGTTIETNRSYNVSKAPHPHDRIIGLLNTPEFPKMIAMEPIMDFDIEIITGWIKSLLPLWVVIGADSKGHGLPEPPKRKIESLIFILRQVTEVKLKKNLNRLLR